MNGCCSPERRRSREPRVHRRDGEGRRRRARACGSRGTDDGARRKSGATVLERKDNGVKMRYLVVVVLCCVCVVATAQTLYPSLGGVTEATPSPGLYGAVVNYLFDQVLKAITASSAIDPLSVPNTTRHFQTKFIVNVDAEAGLYNGRLTGLSSMHRTGDCHVTVGSDGVQMRVDLGAGPVTATYRGEVKLMAFSRDVTIVCVVNNMQIIVEAVQKPGGKPELQRFSVQKLEGVRVTVEGLGTLGGVANALSVLLTTVFEEEVRRAVEESVRTLFAEKLAELGSTIPAALIALG